MLMTFDIISYRIISYIVYRFVRYIIIVGKFPFEGGTVYALFENIAKGAYQEIPDWVDEHLADLIRSILEVDPNKRCSIQQIRDHP